MGKKIRAAGGAVGSLWGWIGFIWSFVEDAPAVIGDIEFSPDLVSQFWLLIALSGMAAVIVVSSNWWLPLLGRRKNARERKCAAALRHAEVLAYSFNDPENQPECDLARRQLIEFGLVPKTQENWPAFARNLLPYLKEWGLERTKRYIRDSLDD